MSKKTYQIVNNVSCPECDKTFNFKSGLSRHLKAKGRGHYWTKEQIQAYYKSSGLNLVKTIGTVNARQVMKSTWLEKYGVDDINNCPDIQKKMQEGRVETSRKRYGVDYPLQSEVIKEKIKETNLELYGVENVFSAEVIKEKLKETWLKNYGVDNPSKSPRIIKKINETFIKRYGKDWYVQTEEFKEKRHVSYIEKYGTDHACQNDIVKAQIRKTNENNGYWTAVDLLSDLDNYYREVWIETRKHTSELFSMWDGTCFYTNDKCITTEEYKIKNPDKHFNCNKLQPQVDHKISILHGFKNNLDPTYIGSKLNLCICSKTANSAKRDDCYFD